MKRLARPTDFAGVYRIYQHESVIPFLGHDPMPADNFREIFAGLLAGADFFVYEKEDVVAAFYRSFRRSGRTRHVAQLATLAVAPEYQGQGLATRMLQEEIAALESAGVTRIQLTVESDNPKAIRLYQKLGFETEGRLRDYYRRAHEDHWVDDLMMARLSQRP